MKKLKHIQNGGITILLVILVGLGVMAGVGSLANSVGSKKETGIAAHAQSNAQMLAWIGTNAFYEYLKTQGLKGVNVFKGMDGKDVPLKSTGLHTIKAKNVKIGGDCTADGDVCEVSANISASSMASQAANTIHVLYRMNVSGGLVKPESKLQATFSGATDIFGKIYAEKAGAEAEITVKGGDLYIGSMARINDFSKVTFNVEGNVRINCEQSKCTRVQQMDINATGWIEITDTISANADFGNLSAKKWIKGSYLRALNLSAGEFVELRMNSNVENIQAGSYVLLESGTKAKNIDANGNVKVDLATAEDIRTKGDVNITDGGKANNILSNGNVTVNIAGTTVNGDIKAKGYVNVNTGPNLNVNGNIYAEGNATTTDGASVYVFGAGVKVGGRIYANGYVQALYGAINGVTTTGDVKLGLPTLAASGVNGGGGSVQSNGAVYVGGNSSNVGNVSARGSVQVGTSGLAGSKGAVGHIQSGGSVKLFQGSTANNVQAVVSVQIGTSGLVGTAAYVKDINSGSTVEMYQGSTADNIQAVDAVKLGTNGLVGTAASAKNIISGSTVKLYQGSSAGHIQAVSDVELRSSSSKNITTGANVEMYGGSSAEDIQAYGSVQLGEHNSSKATARNIYAGSSVSLYQGSSAGDIKAVGNVFLQTDSTAANVQSNTKVELRNRATVNSIVSHGTVEVGVKGSDRGHVTSSITAVGNVGIYYASHVGNVNSQGKVTMHGTLPSDYSKAGAVCSQSFDGQKTGLLDYWSTSSRKTYPSGCTFSLPAMLNRPGKPSSPAAPSTPSELARVVVAAFEGVDVQAIKDRIDGKFDTETHVDARAYKGDANYIFTKENGVDRVFLNYLKNPADGTIYWYKKDPSDTKFKQYYETAAGVKGIVGDGKGFYIGKYTLDGSARVGAICQTRNSSNKYCTSEIISFIPRVGDRDRALGTAFETLFHDSISNIWYIKNLEHDSSIDNATIAPGIFYFEGKLEVHGRAELESGPSSNVYTNSFLAEGSIEAVTTSPRIYSPYNILRVKPNAAIICDRKFGNVNKTIYDSPPATSPSTQGNKFLIPINLCQDATNFKYNMDLDPVTGDTQMVTIDGVQVPKLDLGHVAIMSNMNVRIGTCSQIFGDVLARGRLETTGSCGITDEKQKVVGMVTTQNASDNLGLHNSLNADTSLYLPDRAQTGDPKHSGSGGLLIDTSSVEMIWAKSM